MSERLPVQCTCEGEAHRDFMFSARDYISGDTFRIVRCANCGLAHTEPVPTQWERHYPPAYYGAIDADRFPPLVEWFQRTLYKRRVERVRELNGGRPGKVLDIGCGRGFLLRAFQQQGWEVMGTEMSEPAAAYARQKLGLPVQIGQPQFPENSFDAVIMWHVLEHSPRPCEMLRQAYCVLRPGGVLLVAVPNFGSLEARLARDKWFHLDVPRHLTHFAESSLLRCLEQSGFRRELTSRRSPEYDWFSATQSCLNRTGLKHNFLYNSLRQRGARTGGQGNIVQWLAHAVLLPLAGMVGFLAMLGGGSTQIIFARKPMAKPRPGAGA